MRSSVPCGLAAVSVAALLGLAGCGGPSAATQPSAASTVSAQANVLSPIKMHQQAR
jgi:hypothetical protein